MTIKYLFFNKQFWSEVKGMLKVFTTLRGTGNFKKLDNVLSLESNSLSSKSYFLFLD